MLATTHNFNVQQIHNALSVFGVSSQNLQINNANISQYRTLVDEYAKLLTGLSKKATEITELRRSLQSAIETNEVLELKVKKLEADIEILSVKEVGVPSASNGLETTVFDILGRLNPNDSVDLELVSSLKSLIGSLKKENESLKQQNVALKSSVWNATHHSNIKHAKAVIATLLKATSAGQDTSKLQKLCDENHFEQLGKVLSKTRLSTASIVPILNTGDYNASEGLRNNNIVLSQHVNVLEKEIETLKQQFFNKTVEYDRVELAYQTSVCQVSQLKSDNERYVELNAALNEEKMKYSRERFVMQRSVDELEKRAKELDIEIRGYRREKDLMMATYSRLIKENERLHSKLQSLSPQTQLADEQMLKLLESKLVSCTEQIGDLKQVVRDYESRLLLAEQAKSSAESKFIELKDKFVGSSDDTKRHSAYLEAIEKDKTAAAKTISDLTEEVIRLRKEALNKGVDFFSREASRKLSMAEETIRELKGHNKLLSDQLKSINNEHHDLINAFKNLETPASKSVGKAAVNRSLSPIASSDSGDEYLEQAERIIREWDRTSAALQTSRNVQSLNTHQLKQKLDEENKRLVEIVKQVKEDLEQAAQSSPR